MDNPVPISAANFIRSWMDCKGKENKTENITYRSKHLKENCNYIVLATSTRATKSHIGQFLIVFSHIKHPIFVSRIYKNYSLL